MTRLWLALLDWRFRRAAGKPTDQPPANDWTYSTQRLGLRTGERWRDYWRRRWLRLRRDRH